MIPTKSIKYNPSKPAQNSYYWDKWMETRNPHLGQDIVQHIFDQWVAGEIGLIVHITVVNEWQMSELKTRKEENRRG